LKQTGSTLIAGGECYQELLHNLDESRVTKMGLASMMAKRKVRSGWETMSQSHIDTDALLKDWTGDVVWDGTSELSVGQTIKGRKAVADWFQRWEQEFPQRKLVERNVCMKGTFWPSRNNVVMVDWTCTETDKQGREYAFDGVTVLHMQSMKIVKVTEYISFAGLPQLSSLLTA
jgi:ketosteroid isomerase-like protein